MADIQVSTLTAPQKTTLAGLAAGVTTVDNLGVDNLVDNGGRAVETFFPVAGRVAFKLVSTAGTLDLATTAKLQQIADERQTDVNNTLSGTADGNIIVPNDNEFHEFVAINPGKGAALATVALVPPAAGNIEIINASTGLCRVRLTADAAIVTGVLPSPDNVQYESVTDASVPASTASLGADFVAGSLLHDQNTDKTWRLNEGGTTTNWPADYTEVGAPPNEAGYVADFTPGTDTFDAAFLTANPIDKKGDWYRFAAAGTAGQEIFGILPNDGGMLVALVDAPDATNAAHWTFAAKGVKTIDLQDATVIAGAEFTEPRRMSLQQIDERIFFNGKHVDLRGSVGATLTAMKWHIVNNTTTLDLTVGNEFDRAALWNVQTKQLTYYQHDGTQYQPEAEDHEHTVLDNIAVFVRSAGTNAGSAVQLDFFDKDGVAYPSTDWTVSTAPVTGLESYTAHGPIIVSDVPYTGTFAITHNKQGFLFFKYVGENANGLSSVTYAGTNGANSDGQIIVNFVGTNYHVDFENKAAVELTEFTKEAPAEAAAKSWVFSTDNMNAADGDKIILMDNHSVNLPSTTNLESVQFAPASGNWSSIAAGTGSFIPDAGWDFLNGQNLLFGNDVLTVIADAANTNWIGFSGSDDVPQQEQRYETVALLPNPTTVASGTIAVVYDDPTPANSRIYVARGPAGGNAVAWS